MAGSTDKLPQCLKPSLVVPHRRSPEHTYQHQTRQQQCGGRCEPHVLGTRKLAVLTQVLTNALLNSAAPWDTHKGHYDRIQPDCAPLSGVSWPYIAFTVGSTPWRDI